MPEQTRTRLDRSHTAPPGVDRAPIRLALVVGGLVLALVAGFGIGRLTGSSRAGGSAGTSGTGAADHTHPPGTAPHDHATGSGTSGGAVSGTTAIGGLSLSADGYTLAPVATTWTVGKSQELRFRILGPDNRPVTSFAVVHERPMHLIVVRRDLAGYQHLHPVMAPDGTWTVPLRLPAPGVWRAYADFTAEVGGRRSAVTLGTDLVVAGDYRPRPLPSPAREAGVDGFTVAYEGTPQIGATQPLLFRVYRGGGSVPDLQSYLGAYGHLVALREGDLAYLHVHPEPQLAGGAVKFWLAAPGPGRYRLFFDFQVGGAVHTAEFTVTVP
jgi:hypothetical protein